MYQIIICCPDQKMSNEIKSIVFAFEKKYKRSFRINSFLSGDQISSYFHKLSDIAIFVFQSINLENTNDQQTIFESFHADTQFIVISPFNSLSCASIQCSQNKTFIPNTKEAIFDALIKCFETLDVSCSQVKILTDRELKSIIIKDIVYFESNGHRVIINYVNQQKKLTFVSCVSSLKSFEQQLYNKGFLRVHKCYLINMYYVRKFQFNFIELNFNIVLPASVKKYRQNKLRYNDWSRLML